MQGISEGGRSWELRIVSVGGSRYLVVASGYVGYLRPVDGVEMRILYSVSEPVAWPEAERRLVQLKRWAKEDPTRFWSTLEQRQKDEAV